jgi:hypothetical protein
MLVAISVRVLRINIIRIIIRLTAQQTPSDHLSQRPILKIALVVIVSVRITSANVIPIQIVKAVVAVL